jgi:dolichol-phosphate mannosyltransferase
MSRSTQNDFVGTLLQRCHQLRSDYAELTRAVLFGLVGLSGMVIDLGTLYLLIPAVGFATARAIAIGIAMTWNFALNRAVTFRSKTHDSLLRQYWRFVLSCSLGAAVNWSVSLLLASTVAICREHVLLSAVGGVLAGFLLNFQLCRRWVFGSSQKPDSERKTM